jgi:hypothetical protein
MVIEKTKMPVRALRRITAEKSFHQPKDCIEKTKMPVRRVGAFGNDYAQKF